MKVKSVFKKEYQQPDGFWVGACGVGKYKKRVLFYFTSAKSSGKYERVSE